MLTGNAPPTRKRDRLRRLLGGSSAVGPHGADHPVPTSHRADRDLGGDFLNKALQLLSEQERTTIREHVLSTVGDIDSVLLGAYSAAEDKQKLCENKRWTFTFRGHTVKLRDEADKVIRWLNRFGRVGDIAVNVDPIHAALPWAGIRFLLEVQNITSPSIFSVIVFLPDTLQVAVSESRQMGALLIGLKTAFYTINRLKVYLDFVCDLPEAPARANFESSLTELHALILQFLAKAIRIYQKNVLSRAFDSFWKHDEVINFETECCKIGARVEIEARNCDRSLSKLQQEDAARHGEGLRKLTKELKNLQETKDSIDKMETGIAMLWNSLVEDKQAAILEWTSDIPYLDNHLTARKGRTEGTGEWIFHHARYEEWETSHQPMILWLHGIRKFLLSPRWPKH